MIKYFIAAALLAGTAVSASAQDASPDGSRPFGIEPYVGVMGGYHSFDRQSEFGSAGRYGKPNGALIEGLAGVNVPLGAVFVGVEGNAAKGFNDIDWEYGVRGRAGFRAGTSGLLYASAGYQWVNAKSSRGFSDQKAWVWGGGVEVGPKDIGLGGITDSAGPRLRLSIETYDFDSVRPMVGVIFHF